MRRVMVSHFEREIVKTIDSQKNSYLEDVRKSTEFESYFTQALKSPKTINLRSFIRENLNALACLFGVPSLVLLSPSFTFGRSLSSCLASILTFNKKTTFKLVFANLTNLSAFCRVQTREVQGIKKFEKFRIHNLCFIETYKHVISPSFNFIVEKQLFYKMMGPIVYEVITSEELNESVIFKRMKKQSKKQNLSEPVYDYTFMSMRIDELLTDSFLSNAISVFPKGHSKRLREIDSLLYDALIKDRKLLAKVCYNINAGETFCPCLPSIDEESDNDFKYLYSMLTEV